MTNTPKTTATAAVVMVAVGLLTMPTGSTQQCGDRHKLMAEVQVARQLPAAKSITWTPEAKWRDELAKDKSKVGVWVSCSRKLDCPACKVVEKNVYPDRAVASFVAKYFVCVKIDNPGRLAAWRVPLVPTSLFVSRDGKVISIQGVKRHNTPKDPKRMVALLEAAWAAAARRIDPRSLNHVESEKLTSGLLADLSSNHFFELP